MPLKTNLRNSVADTSFKIPFVFLGNETLATGVESKATILNSLIEAGWTPDALLLAQPGPRRQSGAVEELAQTHSISVHYLQQKSEILPVIERYSPVFAVLAAFGMIVPSEVLDAIPEGIANIHPSLLPRWRGSSPIEQTILAGDDEAGVSLMQLDNDMDTGALYDQRVADIDPKIASKQQLFSELSTLGAQMLLDHIDDIAAGVAATTPQSDDNISISPQINKADGRLDWSQPAIFVEAQIRAYTGWPKAQATLADTEVTIHEAAVSNNSSETVDIAPGQIIPDSSKQPQLQVVCGEGVLTINQLQPAGKKLMSGSDFIRGYVQPGN